MCIRDRPKREQYTYERHVEWTHNIIKILNLDNITLFGQDWGGLIGLRLVANQPELFKGMVLANTSLPIGKGTSEGFEAWKKYSQEVEVFDSGKIVQNASLKKLTDDEIQTAIDSLPGTYKDVVLLADVQGFSYKEIAEILDVPDGTVMSRLHRARAKLKDLLFDYMTSRRLIYQDTKDISAELETVGGASRE